MRKIFCLILALLLTAFMAIPGYASEISNMGDDGMTGDVYAKYVRAVQREEVALQGGSASVTVDGYTVSVSGAPGDAATLRVVPIPAAETEAWSWISGCIDDSVTILTILDIYFQDIDGNRINASGVPVTVIGADEDTIVFAVATNGTTAELDGSFTDDRLTFTANGSNYYVLVKKVTAPPAIDHTVTIEKTAGGNVRVSSMNPKTGDTVTITVLPDEGKEIDKISVKTASGDQIALTDQGNGVYSYVQPNSDVTVSVSFKDKALPPATEYTVTVKKPSGGTVEVSDATPVAGQTVIITTKPDSGKVLQKITVTDEAGKTIPVTDRGDGTYSYVQPDGNVTVQVTFKNKSISSWFDNPQTGDTSRIYFWLIMLGISAMILLGLFHNNRKRRNIQG